MPRLVARFTMVSRFGRLIEAPIVTAEAGGSGGIAGRIVHATEFARASDPPKSNG